MEISGRTGSTRFLHRGEINMAVRAVKWPGRANLAVSLVAIHKGKWNRKRSLDGQEVSMISAYFENTSDVGDPVPLIQNANRVYQGSIFLGDGFLLTHEEASRLLKADTRNREVVFPVINGKEANSEPDQKPGRSIINFSDWSEDRARSYPLPFQIVENKVKPERTKGGSNRKLVAFPASKDGQ